MLWERTNVRKIRQDSEAYWQGGICVINLAT